MSRENDIMVSICCAAYNHEKYIRQALDGFISQKTNFKYEILVHDDASTDGTPDIIREYEEKYPDIIKPIYQTENQYSKNIMISWVYQYPRAKGKYIAMCEGDDFWCNENKLQEQFDIMEKYSNVVLCTHKVGWITEDGQNMDGAFPQDKLKLTEGILPSDQFIAKLIYGNAYLFHTNSYFMRKDVLMKLVENPPEFALLLPVGDQRILWYSALSGDVYYLDKEYSKYRCNVPGSWSHSQNKERNAKTHTDIMVAAYKSLDKYTNHKYHKGIKHLIYQITMRRIRKWKKVYSLKEAIWYADDVTSRIINRVLTILKGEVKIKEWWNRRKKELQNGK